VVCVSVANNGPGVPLKERVNLFDRFMRLRTKNGALGGIGCGLSVVKSIGHEHGGQVGVDSNPSGGSIFWFPLHPENNLYLICYRFVIGLLLFLLLEFHTL
jgi:signal transduction histidine kinase